MHGVCRKLVHVFEINFKLGIARGEWSNRMGSAAQECPPTTDLERANVRIPFYSVFYPYTWRIALRARQIKAKIELWFMEH